MIYYICFLKNYGAMLNPNALVYNKMNGVEEHHNLRELYKNEHAIVCMPVLHFC